jgi:hypothetical protein
VVGGAAQLYVMFPCLWRQAEIAQKATTVRS